MTVVFPCHRRVAPPVEGSNSPPGDNNKQLRTTTVIAPFLLSAEDLVEEVAEFLSKIFQRLNPSIHPSITGVPSVKRLSRSSYLAKYSGALWKLFRSPAYLRGGLRPHWAHRRIALSCGRIALKFIRQKFWQNFGQKFARTTLQILQKIYLFSAGRG